MKKKFFNSALAITFTFALTSFTVLAQIPTTWNSTGIGGGGALFNPSINPANSNEIYVACDMSEYFHSTNFGTSYSSLDFKNIQSGSNGVVRFTNNANILYSINDANDLALPVKSIDGGQTWNSLSGNPDPSEWTYYLFADYGNPNIMVMSYYSKVYITLNGGTTFTLVHNANSNGTGIVVAGVFFDGNNIYIATNDGLFVSTNGGTNFSLNTATGLPSGKVIYSFAGAKSGITTRFFALVANSSDIYAGFAGYDYWQLVKGIYSLDYGSNWVQQQTGINLNQDFLMECDMAENDINTCYLAGSNTTGYPNVMKTTNGGSNWTHVFSAQNNLNINTGWCGSGGDRDWGYAEVFFGLAVAKNDANKVVVTDFGYVHKTSDGGTTWQQAYLNSADQNPSGAQTPHGHNYHGVGIENTTCWQVYWIDQNNMWAGFSDIRGIRSNDAGSSWNMNYSGNDQNSTYRIVKNNSGSTLYEALSTIHDMYQSTRLQDATLDASNSGKIIFSTDNGTTWSLLHDFSHPVYWLATDPTNSNRMYASVINHGSSLGGIYVTNNLQNGASSTWTKLSDPPRTEGHPACIVVLNDGSVVCTYSGRRDAAGAFTASSGVFIWNGTTWTDVSDTKMYYWCNDIVVDPNDVNQNTWYVGVFKGWGTTQVNNAGGGLWKTTNRGTSWTRINTIDRVTSITFNPSNANQIYMTTETQGLWYSNNINAATPTFTQVASYPFRQPERVFFNPYSTSEVWVTSFGNGMRMGTTCTAPTVSISAGGATTFCKGENVTLTATPSGSVSYQWTKNNSNINGATNNNYTATKTATYAVNVSNSCGNASSNTIVVSSLAAPTATITPSGTVNMCAGDTTLLTANSGGGMSYQWYKGNSLLNGATNIFFNATVAGKYKVKVTKNSNGCSKTSSATSVNITCKSELQVEGLRLLVFPNPTHDVFTIQFADDENYDLLVVDVLGRSVVSFKNVNHEIIFGKEFSAGIYFIQVLKNGEPVAVMKVVRV